MLGQNLRNGTLKAMGGGGGALQGNYIMIICLHLIPLYKAWVDIPQVHSFGGNNENYKK